MNTPRITNQEIEIIKKAQAGDEKSFNTLYYKYKPFVENLLFQYLTDMDEAKDLANVVFMKVYKKLPLFKAYDSFGGWLRIISNHTAIDYLRKHVNNMVFISEDDAKLDDNIDYSYSESSIIDKITYKNVLKEFEKLPPRTQKIFYMFYIKNFTIQQISKRLGIPVGTIKSLLSRTRKQLQTKFKQL